MVVVTKNGGLNTLKRYCMHLPGMGRVTLLRMNTGKQSETDFNYRIFRDIKARISLNCSQRQYQI